ncbi:otefin [Toxorhynchites rutilus septentrionalis]|uniref:otefin n=1 Tax=Toxorhynchites rutilus septentrionalis TaxID=329112 RepID=UPI00247879A9|nr:otefin [Toxorhynchites rutilus septentrionalis]
MDNIDDLSNEDLRLKLLEYGMANMPVTQTTRKVLIKKLKNHMENANSKVRRETIHVAKYSSDEESVPAEEPKKAQKKESNRRATIGASAAKLSKTLPVMPDLPPPKPAAEKPEKVDPASKRRSGRLTPLQNKEDIAPVVAAPQEPMIVENSDDEEEMPQIAVRTRDRKSKSPSLSRGETVTTSYIHQAELSVKPPIIEEMEIDLTESTDEVMADPPEPAPKVRRPPLTPTREPRFTSTMSKRTTTSGISGLSQNVYSESTAIFEREPSPEQPTPPPISRGRYSEVAPSKIREEIRLDPTDSPYLSEFTRRLSRLKAESSQLNAVRDHPIRRTIAASYTSSPVPSKVENDYVQSRLAAVRGIRPEGSSSRGGGDKGDIRASLRQVILALDRKYSIKRMFYLLIVTLIVIFLFVFFFL